MVLEHGFERVGAPLAAAALAFILVLPAHAHHSAASFDSERVVELTGVVKRFQWTNPHTWIQLLVQGDGDGQVEWSIEAGGPNSLARQGWRPSTFSPGDQVTIRIRPMRNGAPGGGFVGARFPDGTIVGRWEE